MDHLDPQFKRLLDAKAARRRSLARAAFPEKIAALMQLQRMAAPILRQRGRIVTPWRTGATSNLALAEEKTPYGKKQKDR